MTVLQRRFGDELAREAIQERFASQRSSCEGCWLPCWAETSMRLTRPWTGLSEALGGERVFTGKRHDRSFSAAEAREYAARIRMDRFQEDRP